MTWNCMTVLPHGVETGGLYPVPTGDKRGVEQEQTDSNPESWDIQQLRVYRDADAQWHQQIEIVGNDGKLIVSDGRVTLSFKKVPKNRSMFVPIALVQSAAGVGKNRGESFVGHVRYEWLMVVGARNFTSGLLDNDATLRMTVVDTTSAAQQAVMIEVVLPGRTKASKIAAKVASAAARHRLAIRDDLKADERDQLESAHAKVWKPPRKGFDTLELPHAFGVNAATAFVDGIRRDPSVAGSPAPANIENSEPSSRADGSPQTGSPVRAPTQAAARPGSWATDPFARFELRYFNGERWTQHVSTSGEVSTDPPVPVPPPDRDAGWKPDPLGRHRHRYFNGNEWTRHVSNDGQTSEDGLEATAPQQ